MIINTEFAWKKIPQNGAKLSIMLNNSADFLQKENAVALANQLRKFANTIPVDLSRPDGSSESLSVSNYTELVEAFRGTMVFYQEVKDNDLAKKFGGFAIKAWKYLYENQANPGEKLNRQSELCDGYGFFAGVQESCGDFQKAAQFYLGWVKFLASRVGEPECPDYTRPVSNSDVCNVLSDYAKLLKEAGSDVDTVEHWLNAATELVNDDAYRTKEILEEIANLPDPPDAPGLPE